MKTLPEPMQINESFLIIFILFIILYLILKKFYVKPYLLVMEEREEKIKGALNRLKEVENHFREKELQYEKELQEARKKALALREKLLEEGKEEREKIVSSAKEYSKDIIEKTGKELEEAYSKELKNAEKHVEHIAKLIVKKILGRETV